MYEFTSVIEGMHSNYRKFGKSDHYTEIIELHKNSKI